MSTTTPRGRGLVAPAGAAVVVRVAATAIVYQGLIGAIASTIAVQGDDGTIIASQATALGTDQIIINAAIVWVNALGGGDVFVDESTYTLTATVNVSASVLLYGSGWATIFNYNAGGNCITFTGDNAKVRDLKIVIVAGAGGVGTRPNCIIADTRTNLEVNGVWTVGDQTVADDGSDVRQCGIVFNVVTFSQISLCTNEDHMKFGISFVVTDNNTVSGNTCIGNMEIGMKLTTCSWNTVTGNMCQGNTTRGIMLTTDSNNNTVSGNTCNGNGTHGIQVTSSSDNAVSGNTCQGNTSRGIALNTGANDNTVTGNTCQGNGQSGINLNTGSNNNTISVNVCQGNTWDGIKVDDSSNNAIVGNTCNDNNFGAVGSFNGIFITDTSSDNLVHSNICNDNGRYGIYIDDLSAERNWVKNNILRGNNDGAFLDAATDSKFASVCYPFTEAIVGAIVTTSPTGVDVDVDTEQALAWGQIPWEAQQVVTIKIWGVATDGPIGAGGQMHLEITFNAGASNAAYNTAGKSWNLVNFDSEEADYVANDVVHWRVTDFWVASELSALTGGDSFEIFAIHEAGADPDGATDCLFRVVEIDYV